MIALASARRRLSATGIRVTILGSYLLVLIQLAAQLLVRGAS